MKKRKRSINKKRVRGTVITFLCICLIGGLFLVLPLKKEQERVKAPSNGWQTIFESWKEHAQLSEEYAEQIADYEATYQTLSRRNRDHVSKADEQTFLQLQQELMENLTSIYDMERAELAINQMAYLLDRPSIYSGDGALTYRRGILIANKQYCMPADFAPGVSEQATIAMQEMAAAAAADGIHIEAFSTYRSYDAQVSIFQRYVASDGEEAANRYSSKPGCSDHQTGMAFDIGSYDQSQWAETTFDNTPAALWLEEHAPEYGFILRYPQEKEAITGYIYESWHYRFVGDLAPRISASGLTLEEYFDLV